MTTMMIRDKVSAIWKYFRPPQEIVIAHILPHINEVLLIEGQEWIVVEMVRCELCRVNKQGGHIRGSMEFLYEDVIQDYMKEDNDG